MLTIAGFSDMIDRSDFSEQTQKGGRSMESSDMLPQALADFIATYSVLVKLHSAKQDELRMSSNLFLVLHTLCAHEDRTVTMSALASELGMMKQQITRLVNDLEKMGLALRTTNEANRRSVTVSVTEAGRARYDGIMSSFAEQLRHTYFATLEPREMDDLVRSVTRIDEVFRRECEMIRRTNPFMDE